VVDFFVGATTIAKERIATTMRNKLLEYETQTKIGNLLTQAMRMKFNNRRHQLTSGRCQSGSGSASA
jgi:hypothetical protein